MLLSHPSRGAWIEMLRRKWIRLSKIASHPSRGAWIEIGAPEVIKILPLVAPLTGCVDRNTITETDYIEEIGRTPHGVRG